jgi:hypothetical protein
MTRLLLLTLLGLLALPGATLAGPVKISPHPSAVSDAGKATLDVANPNPYALRGAAKVAAGGRRIATRSVRLPKRSVTTIELRFGPGAIAALRKAAGRATIKLQVRRSGGRKSTARRKVTLQLPSAGPQAPGAPAGDPGAQPPASDRWVGRMGTEGAYDDLELTVSGGQMQITKPPLVPVYCFENGGSFRTGLSYEPFLVPGPWTIGTDANVAQQGISLNQIVTSGARSITYKVTGTTQEAGKVAGTLGMSYFDSQLDIFSNKITFVNCSGSQSFEAVPAAG